MEKKLECGCEIKRGAGGLGVVPCEVHDKRRRSRAATQPAATTRDVVYSCGCVDRDVGSGRVIQASCESHKHRVVPGMRFDGAPAPVIPQTRKALTCPKHPQCQLWIRRDPVTTNTWYACAICGLDLENPTEDEPAEPLVIRTFEAYDREASRTDANHPLPYYAGGLCEEAGELWKLMKRAEYHGKPQPTREQKLDELGDALWLLDRLAVKWGVTLAEAAAFNIEKLRGLYPKGAEQARTRDRQPWGRYAGIPVSLRGPCEECGATNDAHNPGCSG